MMCAGWIRFRASLMAMRRTSWIDQRINDDVNHSQNDGLQPAQKAAR
jgi:hypothetical protein